jgi:hypothetical protein
MLKMKLVKFFLPSLIFLVLVTAAACKFQFNEVVPTAPLKSVLAIYTECYVGEEPLVFVTRTRNIGERIKWDFNYRDIVEKTRDTTIYNVGQYLLFDTVKDVTVQMFEAGKLIRTFEQYNPYTKISYTADKIDYKPNVEYTLKVFAPGFDTVFGRQKAPSDVKLKKADFSFNNTVSRERSTLLSEIVLEFDDIAEQENYYAAEVYYRKGPENKKTTTRLLPIKLDANATNGGFLSDKTFDGKRYVWRLGFDLGDKLPPQQDSVDLVVYFRSAAKDDDLYQKSLEINNLVGESYFIEPTSTFTNLTGGIGVFTILGRASISTIKLYK